VAKKSRAAKTTGAPDAAPSELASDGFTIDDPRRAKPLLDHRAETPEALRVLRAIDRRRRAALDQDIGNADDDDLRASPHPFAAVYDEMRYGFEDDLFAIAHLRGGR